MQKKKTFIASLLVLSVLLLGIGYAAISNITLKINGTATATASNDNFKVKFDGTPTVSDPLKVTDATITDDLNAKFTVSGLTAKGDKETVTYTILNDSPDLSASITAPAITNSNDTYFKVTTDWTDAKTVTTKKTVTVTVTVELIKTPIGEDETSNIGLTFTASPVQP